MPWYPGGQFPYAFRAGTIVSRRGLREPRDSRAPPCISSAIGAMATQEHYSKGRIVTVHYNRKDPKISMLEVDVTADNWFVF